MCSARPTLSWAPLLPCLLGLIRNPTAHNFPTPPSGPHLPPVCRHPVYARDVQMSGGRSLAPERHRAQCRSQVEETHARGYSHVLLLTTTRLEPCAAAELRPRPARSWTWTCDTAQDMSFTHAAPESPQQPCEVGVTTVPHLIRITDGETEAQLNRKSHRELRLILESEHKTILALTTDQLLVHWPLLSRLLTSKQGVTQEFQTSFSEHPTDRSSSLFIKFTELQGWARPRAAPLQRGVAFPTQAQDWGVLTGSVLTLTPLSPARHAQVERL